MSAPQPTLLSPPPPAGRFLTFGLAPGADGAAALARVARLDAGPGLVVGIGEPLLRAVGKSVPGLRGFPALGGPGGAIPSTQGALFVSIDGADPGETVHRARAVVGALGVDLRLDEEIAVFVYAGGRDLSGYEDGTENPKGDRAREVALVADGPLAGSSFVATQRWVHDLARLEGHAPEERDAIVGRARASNEELASAPASAHVKRAAQESYEPAAFMLRRSMPWGDARENGLLFVAYGASLDPFERVLRRMVGLDDGVADALFRFTRPVTGGYYWCPALRGTHLDLAAVR